jgi:hypothetical protein
MSITKPRDLSKERFWRRSLHQWRNSGLGIAEFCRQQGLSAPSFYAWRRTLAQRDATAAAVHFVPVRVLAETVPGAADRDATGLELVLEGGRRLHIGPAFDDATLRRLLSVLEEGHPCS